MATDQPDDLGLVEAGHFIWNIFRRKVRGGPMESAQLAANLTPRGQLALDAFASAPGSQTLESTPLADAAAREALLRVFFKQESA